MPEITTEAEAIGAFNVEGLDPSITARLPLGYRPCSLREAEMLGVRPLIVQNGSRVPVSVEWDDGFRSLGPGRTMWFLKPPEPAHV